MPVHADLTPSHLCDLRGAARAINAKAQLFGPGFAYDANGNPTLYGGTAATYSPDNGLLSFGPGFSAEYRSDGLRARKTEGGQTRWYVYDGVRPVLELDASGAVAAVATFGPTGLLSRREGGATVLYQFDPRGGTAHRLSAAGSVLSSHTWDAFGNGSSTVPTDDPYANFGAQHGYLRDATGLLLTTFRYYDPAQGRFLNRDPIGYAGGLNLYAYTGNNPVNFIDPLGLARTVRNIGQRPQNRIQTPMVAPGTGRPFIVGQPSGFIYPMGSTSPFFAPIGNNPYLPSAVNRYDPILMAPGRGGSQPCWKTIRERYWRREVTMPGAREFWNAHHPSNSQRMANGKAPLVAKGGGLFQPVVLHHVPPMSIGGQAFIPVPQSTHQWLHSLRPPSTPVFTSPPPPSIRNMP